MSSNHLITKQLPKKSPLLRLNCPGTYSKKPIRGLCIPLASINAFYLLQVHQEILPD
ncbi:hypothetical protein Mucpa_0177 [Mucilaginibacter paludis DSM 18603]|uniref:Uncharacterized protein n=1 Tax=Mucilaginibacter paludis DSM 18603 TaxID=714943 RepID=H1YEW0_9SPHI|nr:hypothetical protein Mucpa_0177 [Mucilaginibacter paludis DSM 18603]